MKVPTLITCIIAATLLAEPSAAFQVDELTAHWNFDEATGVVFADNSGNALNASIGVGVTLGQPGAFPSTVNSALFDANLMGMAKVPNLPPLSELVDNFSVAVWVKVEPGGPWTIRRVFGGSLAGWSCGVLPNGLRFTTKGIQDFDLGVAYPMSTWFHLVFVFDVAHDVTYYIDGVQVGVRTGSSPANVSNGPWLIGAFSQAVEFWNGNLDDLQIYKGTLSAADVSFLFQNPGATVAPGGGFSHCFGDISGSGCPCGNMGAAGEGCANSSGTGAILTAAGSSSVIIDNLQFIGMQLVPGQTCVLFSGHQTLNAGNGLLFGDGLRCAGMQVQRLGIRIIDVNGNANWGPGLAGLGQWQPGDSRSFQVWYQDANGSPCGGNFNTSQAISVNFAQ